MDEPRFASTGFCYNCENAPVAVYRRFQRCFQFSYFLSAPNELRQSAVLR
jgi:hypothetical protein